MSIVKEECTKFELFEPRSILGLEPKSRLKVLWFFGLGLPLSHLMQSMRMNLILVHVILGEDSFPLNPPISTYFYLDKRHLAFKKIQWP